MAVRLWLREQQKFLLNYIPGGVSLDDYADGLVTGVVDDAAFSVVPRGCVMAKAKVMHCRHKSVPFAVVSPCDSYPSGFVIAPMEIYSAFHNNSNPRQPVVALGNGGFVRKVFDAYYGGEVVRAGRNADFFVLAADARLEDLLENYRPHCSPVFRIELV